MSVTKVNADVFDLTDAYAFSGTVTGTPVTGWEFVSLTTASDSATVVVSFDAGYDYLTTITDLAPASDGQAFCAEVAVSGPTYRTSD